MPEAKQKIEERILDAAERCFEQFGTAKTTVRDVAEVAGVSHMTIYRKFGDRDELFTATTLRVLDRRWAEIAGELTHIHTLDEWILEGLLVNWRRLQNEEIRRRYHHAGVIERGMGVTLTEDGLRSIYRHFEHLLRGNDRKIRDRARNIAEWLHWMSYIMASGSSQRLRTEQDWRRWLAPQISGGIAAGQDSVTP